MDRSCSKVSSKKGEGIIIQVIGLIDNLDKEANAYGKRVRNRYGLHFPELARILHKDNILYAKSVKLMGDRVNAAKMDFSQIVDIECLKFVGARLIAHASSLTNLAKLPGSTIQMLGAEKALFRALETKNRDTPKHGFIYLAPLIAQSSSGKTKGKMSRTLAAKTALAVRYDAFVDRPDNTMGLKIRSKLEARLSEFEKIELSKSTGSAMNKLKIEVYDKDIKTLDAAAATETGDEIVTGEEIVSEKKKSSEMEEQSPEVVKMTNSFGGVLSRWLFS